LSKQDDFDQGETNMHGQHGARQSIGTQIAQIWADVTFAQGRFAEVNRPWVARPASQR
jgi:hypothetical protein